uniref:Leucine-rich repeat-containing G-protein coupled receptor 6 isoform X3 n=1 Tax=Geotrypetes seraphini TaxID=260995 RepID=A0A6P8NBW9_GEOSA|nr:leucine-rich repeat-containing G-protein coupled receptor 6 isoform X3 [Geotrypetes seraphini]
MASILLLLGGLLASAASTEQDPLPSCTPLCRCHRDGVMLWVECSELGLSAVPGSLSPFTAYLDLSMNNISEIQPHAFYQLRFLEELRLSGNQISKIPWQAFSGLYSLKVLMLQNNQLRRIPAEALRDLPNLQSLRLDANFISLVPDRSFEDLRSLRHLWLDDNALVEIPIRALNNLPALQAMTLALNRIQYIPDYAFQNLTSLVVLHLHNNQIRSLGMHCFNGLHSLETLGLHYNKIREIRADTFEQLLVLWSIDLSNNAIQNIHPEAFVTIRSLVRLDLSNNHLATLPLAGLSGLAYLKLKGNLALAESFSKESFPKIRVLEVPYAYQCCAYGACNSFFQPNSLWEAEGTGPEGNEIHKRNLELFPGHTDSHYDPDMDVFQLETEESKLQPSIQCTPSPGPFKPCDYLFDSWLIRLGVWIITLIGLVCNGLIILAVFAAPSHLSPVKFVIGSIAGANLLTGVYCGILAFVDALTFGQFARYGARWELGAGCRITGFISVFASEASILLLTLAAVQCSISVACVRVYGKSPSFSSVKTAALCSVVLSSIAAVLPLFSIGEYGSSPLCLPYPLPDEKLSTLGFVVSLVMLNTLCFLIITGTYIKLYCDLLKGEFDTIWDCVMIKHVAWLIFTNCLLYCPVAFLTFSSMLNLFPISPEVIKSVLLMVLPLPACLNPLLYILFNPHFKDDLRLLKRGKRSGGSSPPSYISEDTEKTSYDSTQALVPFTDADLVFEASTALEVHTRHPHVLEAYTFPPVTFISCQQMMGTTVTNDSLSIYQSCLTDEEWLITSESMEQNANSTEVSFSTGPPAHSFTSHL